MSEISPIAITERTARAAAAQHIIGFEPNTDDIAKLLEVTNRTDLSPDKVAIAIGSGVGLQLEKAKTPLYAGTDLGNIEPMPDQPDNSTLIRLNVVRKTPITEAELSRRLAAQLLNTARWRNQMGRQLPGSFVGGVGLLALIPGTVQYWNSYPNEVETWAWIGGGSTALAIGGLLLRSFRQQDRQHDMAQFGAAPVLRPVIIHQAEDAPGQANSYTGRRRSNAN